jgi:hypothetical protein
MTINSLSYRGSISSEGEAEYVTIYLTTMLHVICNPLVYAFLPIQSVLQVFKHSL